MTYEYAAYLKLLLLCGYPDELQKYIDDALAEQDSLSDVVLELSTVGDDPKKRLSVLNEYLCRAKESNIDFDKRVFDLIMSFLSRKYYDDAMPMREITDLMYRLSVHTERCDGEPWYTMNVLGDLWYEAETGFLDKEDFLHKFQSFMHDKVCLT